MALQLDPPPPSSTAPAPARVPEACRTRNPEPAVPVYRYLLSGGESRLRLTGRPAIALATASLIGLPLFLAILRPADLAPATYFLAAIAATISLATATLVARWSGRSVAILVGFVSLAGWTACSCIFSTEVLLAAVATSIAILIYGLAELANRIERIAHTPAAIAFYAAMSMACLVAGPAPFVVIATVCLGTVLGNENSRGIRFFGSPIGLAVLGMALGAICTPATGTRFGSWSELPGSHAFGSTAIGALLMGAAATWSMVRTGHAAAPLGRLLICWLIGPAGLATAGCLPGSLAIAITVPAWATVSGSAIVHLQRRLYGRRILRQFTLLRARSRAAQGQP